MIKVVVKCLLRQICTRVAVRNCGSYKTRPVASFPTFLTPNTHLGSNTNFNGLRVKGHGRVTIGDNFHSGQGCVILTENHKYDGGDSIPYDSVAYIVRDVSIGDNVWLGDRVMILGGIIIGEGAIVQAGSVVVGDLPNYAIAGGHPAKVFKYRDIDHYLRLKREGKFH